MHSAGREPGAECDSGLTPLVGLCRPPRFARRALYYFIRLAGVARALRARLTACLCYFAPQGGLEVRNVKYKIRSRQSLCDGLRCSHLQIDFVEFLEVPNSHFVLQNLCGPAVGSFGS